jgi:isoaspartyl peptidase/L-asparaginase-like protein (Ntn-hydrolase superfamily)
MIFIMFADYFTVDKRKRIHETQMQQLRQQQQQQQQQRQSQSGYNVTGTVGCVALDIYGNLGMFVLKFTI